MVKPKPFTFLLREITDKYLLKGHGVSRLCQANGKDKQPGFLSKPLQIILYQGDSVDSAGVNASAVNDRIIIKQLVRVGLCC